VSKFPLQFRFSLDALMRLRITNRDAIATQLVSLRQNEQAIGVQVVGNEHERREWLDSVQAEARPVHAQEWIERDRYGCQLDSQRSALVEQQCRIAKEVESMTDRLLVARREVRSLEKLRDRRLEEYHRQQARRELQQSDERSQAQRYRRLSLCESSGPTLLSRSERRR